MRNDQKMDRVDRPQDIKYWYGGIDTAYRYTVGIAGERFFRELRDTGKILASRCRQCNEAYVPPRLYCVKCFSELKDYEEVPDDGWYIHTYSTARNQGGQGLQEPLIWVVAKHRHVVGGLVHRLTRASPVDVTIGMRIRPLPKEKEGRIGSILDLEGFVPSQ